MKPKELRIRRRYCFQSDTRFRFQISLSTLMIVIFEAISEVLWAVVEMVALSCLATERVDRQLLGDWAASFAALPFVELLQIYVFGVCVWRGYGRVSLRMECLNPKCYLSSVPNFQRLFSSHCSPRLLAEIRFRIQI